MKALIICDEFDVISQFNSFLSKQGIDSIVYNRFLKALDNIEEINPDLIIVNGEEFPRHWKILSQFTLSNLFKKNIKVFVYSEKALNDEDSKKISLLENTTLLTSLNVSELSKLVAEDELIDDDLFSEEDSICKSNTIEEITEEEINDENDECEDVPTVESIIEENDFSNSEIIDESDEETFGDVDSILDSVEVSEPADEELFGDVENIVETAEVQSPDEELFGDVDSILDSGELAQPEEEAFGDVDSILDSVELTQPDEELFGDVDSILDSVEVSEAADEELFGDVENIVETAEIESSDDSETDTLITKKEIILRTLINSPLSKKIIVGNLIFNSFEDMKITFVPDFETDLNQFNKDVEISNAFYEYEKDCISYKAKILNIPENANKIEMEFIE